MTQLTSSQCRLTLNVSLIRERRTRTFPTPLQPPSREVQIARAALEKQSIRKWDRGEFNSDGLTSSAKNDPVGRIILSIPDGRLGVEGYRKLQQLYSDGVIRGEDLPNFSNLSRSGSDRTSSGRQVIMIVCGGQTGVDQAALQIAENLGYEHSGVIPRNRATASGPLDKRHRMIENHSDNVDDRTQHNFTGADGTLVLYKGQENDGTALTIVGPIKVGRPLFEVNLNEELTDELVQSFADWLKVNDIRCLNVGGPRQSYYEDRQEKGDIKLEAESLLEKLLTHAEARLAPSAAQGVDLDDLNMP